MIYLASPYTNYTHGTFWAYDQACRVTARFSEIGIPVFSPVVYGHTISQRLPHKPHEFWTRFCEPFMYVSKSMLVLTMESWEISVGLRQEVAFFKKRKKPVVMISVAEAMSMPKEQIEELISRT